MKIYRYGDKEHKRTSEWESNESWFKKELALEMLVGGNDLESSKYKKLEIEFSGGRVIVD